jgi:hypothetical protein
MCEANEYQIEGECAIGVILYKDWGLDNANNSADMCQRKNYIVYFYVQRLDGQSNYPVYRQWVVDE